MIALKVFPPSVPGDDPNPLRSAWVTLDGWAVSGEDETFYGTAWELIEFTGMTDARMHVHHDRVMSISGTYVNHYVTLRPVI